MALFFLTYHPKGETAQMTLFEELEKFNAVKVLDATWCFDKDNTSCGEMRDHFREFISNADGLVIVQPRTWSTYNVEESPTSAQKSS